jgi:hypothetical protein
MRHGRSAPAHAPRSLRGMASRQRERDAALKERNREGAAKAKVDDEDC